MPELPEVEVVRRGLAGHVVGRRLDAVEVRGLRAVRRQVGGADELVARLSGRTVTAAHRRGKYLWLTLDGVERPGADCLHVHLGMSGQMLVVDPTAEPSPHTHVVAGLSDGRELRFCDQRTFGGWTVLPLASGRGGRLVPESVTHIAPDPFEEGFDELATARAIRRRDTEVKRLLLDQTVVAGIGNIYADESLWRARVHGRRRASALPLNRVRALVGHAREVMAAALGEGGTSFDRLYVDVNGASGYFDRSLAVYGQTGRPCPECGTAIVREEFMNRGLHFCPVCQPAPRRRAGSSRVRPVRARGSAR